MFRYISDKPEDINKLFHSNSLMLVAPTNWNTKEANKKLIF
jgi:hypothetical protein